MFDTYHLSPITYHLSPITYHLRLQVKCEEKIQRFRLKWNDPKFIIIGIVDQQDIKQDIG
jgi:hypothetical protein